MMRSKRWIQQCYYVGTLMFATMGASAGSEGALTRVYDRFVKREGDPPATTMIMGYDSIPVQADKSLYDLAILVQRERGAEGIPTEHKIQRSHEDAV